MQDFTNDIPLQLAIDAYNGTSFSSERIGAQEVKDWATMMTEDYTAIMATAKDEEQTARLETMFSEYHARLLTMKKRLLYSHSGIYSAMITGPANFPVARMENKNRVYHKHLEEYIAYRERGLARMRKEFSEPTSIRTGEDGAVEALKAKIAKLENKQERMKLINGVVNKCAKKGLDKHAELLPLDLADDEQEAVRRYNGYMHFELTNNNAKINAAKEQLAKAERLAATATSEIMVGNVRIVDSLKHDRVMIHFPARLSREHYAIMAKNGYRHSKTNNAFQAYRGAWAMNKAKQVVEGLGL